MRAWPLTAARRRLAPARRAAVGHPRLPGGWLVLLGLSVTADAVAAQAHPKRDFPGPPVPVVGAAPESASPGAIPPILPTLRTPAGAFAASLLVPGSGQAALGVRRWVVYGALEAGFWWAHLDARADFRRFTRRYRDLAWEVARNPGQEPRRDGSWGYYETMSQYVTSGAFDADPAQPGIQPEQDAATYNGTVWEIARGLYLPNGVVDETSPAYERAIQYYQGRAAGPDFLWSWAGSEEDMDAFRGLIEAADDESRTATGILGLILANHLTSAVDALLVARLRGERGPELDTELDRSAHGLRLRLGIRLPLDF